MNFQCGISQQIHMLEIQFLNRMDCFKVQNIYKMQKKQIFAFFFFFSLMLVITRRQDYHSCRETLSLHGSESEQVIDRIPLGTLITKM